MFDEDLLYDILLCLENKNYKEKEKFILENKEILNISYEEGIIKDYLVDKDKDLRDIILNMNCQLQSYEQNINSERSNDKEKPREVDREVSLNKLRMSINNLKNPGHNDSKDKSKQKKQDVVFKDMNYNFENNFNLLDDQEPVIQEEQPQLEHSQLGNEDQLNDSNEFLEEFLKADDINMEDVFDEKVNQRETIKNQDKDRDTDYLGIKKSINKILNRDKIASRRSLERISVSPNIQLNPNRRSSKRLNDQYRPRFAVGQKLRRKNLDNSVDDYVCFDYVDQNGFEEFKQLTKEFFMKKLKLKVGSILSWYKAEMTDCFIKAVKELSFEEIHKALEFIENQKDDEIKKKGGFFSCCSSKEKKIAVNRDYGMRSDTLELWKVIRDIKFELQSCIDAYNEEVAKEKEAEKKGKKQKLKNSKINEFLEINNLQSYLLGSLEEKYEMLYNEQGMEEFLKEEVDKYSELFNIDSIISKQEKRLKMQQIKLNQLEEFKVLNECIVCMDNERSVAFLPCLHFICCETCAFSLIQSECPECHGQIETKRLIIN